MALVRGAQIGSQRHHAPSQHQGQSKPDGRASDQANRAN